jgi:hypothetical protein
MSSGTRVAGGVSFPFPSWWPTLFPRTILCPRVASADGVCCATVQAAFEDVEFCVRARKAGVPVTYDADAIVRHHYDYTWLGLFRCKGVARVAFPAACIAMACPDSFAGNCWLLTLMLRRLLAAARMLRLMLRLKLMLAADADAEAAALPVSA